MWPTIWPMVHPTSPSMAGGVQSTAAGGSAATSRSVRRRRLSKKLKYDPMSVIMGRSFAIVPRDRSLRRPEDVGQEKRLHVGGAHGLVGDEIGLAGDQHRARPAGLGQPSVGAPHEARIERDHVHEIAET